MPGRVQLWDGKSSMDIEVPLWTEFQLLRDEVARLRAKLESGA